MPNERPPPPRHPSKPELLIDEQPERRAVKHHPGVDGAPQARPQRSPTLTGMPAPAAPGSRPPPAPPLPLEYAPTKRPPLPWGKTMRAPTPPEVLAQARGDAPPPTSDSFDVTFEPEVVRNETPVSGLRKPSPLPAPSQRPEEAAVAALRRRAEAAELKAAEADRLRRETKPPESGINDETIGKMVRELSRLLAKKIGLPTALVAMLGGGGYAFKISRDRPAPPPLTAEQLDERLNKFEARVVTRLDKLTITTNEAIDVERCLRRKTDQIGGSLLPAPDRLGAALKQSPFEDDCPDSPKRLPEPKPQ